MATRDLVPRADSEGGIGTTLKRWAAAWFDAINGKDISSGVATTAEVEALSTTYAPLAKGVTNGDSHDHSGGDGAQIDHGALFGLTDDDHTQYAKADGSRAFTGIPSCAVAPTTGNHLVNKAYADTLAGADLTGYIKADCSVPFTGGHIPAEGEYTGFKFTETDAPTNEKKLIYQVDNSQASLLFVNDAETVFNAAWTVDRDGATPTAMTVNPLLIASGGLNADTLNGQDISDGVIPQALGTAKGDLIAYSAAGVPARLGIGTVGSTLVVGPAGLPIYAQRGPGCYFRDIRFAAKAVSVAADRYCLISPNRMLVDINGIAVELTTQQTLNLSLAATWDSVSPDYRVAANRAGKDFYVYVVLVGGVVLSLLCSANATTPNGYTAITSRCVAGFHCLCLSAGTISGHPASGYLTGDIIPPSVWDLRFRPVCGPEGMRYVAGVNNWQDIYIPSVVGGVLRPVFGGTMADGASSPAFDWYDSVEWLGRIGKRLPTQIEFMAGAVGSNEGTNIAGSTDPGTAGGHTDTAGRRMISATFGEDYCGVIWQRGIEPGAVAGTAAWKDQYVAARTSQRGQSYQEPARVALGGSWSSDVNCGSRGSTWANGPLSLSSAFGARGVAEPLAVE